MGPARRSGWWATPHLRGFDIRFSPEKGGRVASISGPNAGCPIFRIKIASRLHEPRLMASNFAGPSASCHLAQPLHGLGR